MADKKNYYGKLFERPEGVIRVKRTISRKRALQERLCESESPSKKGKKDVKNKKKSFGADPPPHDDVTNEDSSLMELFYSKPSAEVMKSKSRNINTSSLSLFASLSPSFTTSASMIPVQGLTGFNNTSCTSPIPVLYNNEEGEYSKESASDLIPLTNSIVKDSSKKRQKLTPAPLTSSPSWGHKAADLINKEKLQNSRLRTNLDTKFAAETEEVEWHQNLCLDWSLKTKLTILSDKPYCWNSTTLKSSEESSGTSAFVRCIDMDPDSRKLTGLSQQGSQLDSSLGAQFHQCCLYWQHPSLPSVNLFPRDSNSSTPLNFSTTLSSQNLNGIRLEDKVLDVMFLEWVEAFRSTFQLLRTRQCPFFYICCTQFTGLFCAAGTQGLDYLQVYVTPSTKSFRESLNKEGIEYSMPYYNFEENIDQGPEKVPISKDSRRVSEVDSESDDDADKWLDEMGISQDVSVSATLKHSVASNAEEKIKSSLILIAGANTLSFFNFLINSKSYIISSVGSLKGLPPTILSPVAFHQATLKSLKVKQSRTKASDGTTKYSIEMVGPILPHILHDLCAILKKTVFDFTICSNPLSSTVNLNLMSVKPTVEKGEPLKANAFELQNLSDCGLSKTTLEQLCKPDNVYAVMRQIQCVNNRYKWFS